MKLRQGGLLLLKWAKPVSGSQQPLRANTGSFLRLHADSLSLSVFLSVN